MASRRCSATGTQLTIPGEAGDFEGADEFATVTRQFTLLEVRIIHSDDYREADEREEGRPAPTIADM